MVLERSPGEKVILRGFEIEQDLELGLYWIEMDVRWWKSIQFLNQPA